MRWFLTPSSAARPARGPRTIATLVAGLALALPATAFALGDYRNKVAEFVQANNDVVTCETCHNDPRGGGPRDRPFFKSLEANGLLVSDVLGTITPALEGIDTKNVDSDGDSVGDIDELRAGFDPNEASSKPPPDNTGGSGSAAGSGGSGPPPGPAGTGGTGGSGTGGRAGSGSTPRAGSGGGDDDDDRNQVELAPGATTKTCSASNARGGSAQGAALLMALTFLTRLRSRRRGRDS